MIVSHTVFAGGVNAYNHGLQIETPVMERPRTNCLEGLFSGRSDLILELIREVRLEGGTRGARILNEDIHCCKLVCCKAPMVASS